MEKNKWFAKDIPLVFELSSEMKFIDIDFPATDECRSGRIIRKKKPLNEQFKSDPDNALWKSYADKIKSDR
jgi:hypothetical protein